MKHFGTFLWGIFLMLSVGCQETEIELPVSQREMPTTFEMGIQVAEMNRTDSRSFSDAIGTKDFPPLWVVVFDGTGYLVEYAKAENMERQGNEIHFKVTLRTTSSRRILHFLLGYVEQLELNFGHESSLIGHLKVEHGQGAYWQRRVMEHGIDVATVKESLQSVLLVRNFAKIRLVNRDTDDFKLTGFYVLNVPDAGSVAPYAGGRFVDYWTGVGLVAKDYATLVEEDGYTGAMPEGTVYVHRPGGEDKNLEWMPGGSSYFLYEHTHRDDPGTTLSVMLKGSYRGGRESYYKVDIVKQEDDRAVYYHILRNFEYLVHINEVVGEGESSFNEACFGLSGNNLSSSIIVRKVQNVSDGTSSLRVAYTDTTLVSADPVTLRYRYVPDISSPQQTYNRVVEAVFLEGTDGTLFDTRIVNDKAENGWATLTLTPLDLPPYPKKQSVLVYSTDNNLSREVVFELRPAYQLGVTCQPKNILEKQGEEIMVDLLLPDQLNEVIFPLSFLIEAQEKGNVSSLSNYLSPQKNEVISVVSGYSVVPGFSHKKSIQYVKTLEYADYLFLPKGADGVSHRLSCHFVTNTAHSASTVYVYNKYFVKTADTFGS